jgi:hypothetical protein
VNFFQPSFKLKSKMRQGARVSKKYERPATPYERLLASDRVTNECKENLRRIFSALDPVDLLSQIRQAQRTLADFEVGGNRKTASEASHTLSHFVKSLSTTWREVKFVLRTVSTPDHERGALAWTRSRRSGLWWRNEQPNTTAKDLFHRLQADLSEPFQPGQLRTLQRRVKQWRGEIARQLVLGSGLEGAYVLVEA